MKHEFGLRHPFKYGIPSVSINCYMYFLNRQVFVKRATDHQTNCYTLYIFYKTKRSPPINRRFHVLDHVPAVQCAKIL